MRSRLVGPLLNRYLRGCSSLISSSKSQAARRFKLCTSSLYNARYTHSTRVHLKFIMLVLDLTLRSHRSLFTKFMIYMVKWKFTSDVQNTGCLLKCWQHFGFQAQQKIVGEERLDFCEAGAQVLNNRFIALLQINNAPKPHNFQECHKNVPELLAARTFFGDAINFAPFFYRVVKSRGVQRGSYNTIVYCTGSFAPY